MNEFDRINNFKKNEIVFVGDRTITEPFECDTLGRIQLANKKKPKKKNKKKNQARGLVTSLLIPSSNYVL